MSPSKLDVLIVGAGVFGTTGAITLAERGHRVRLIDPGPLPHPLAASTDRSKVVRAAYGADPVYTALGVEAIEGWHAWNARWGRPLYHEHGFRLHTRGPMKPDSFEGLSYAALQARGWPVERLTGPSARWHAENYTDGFLDRRAGWADAEEVMKALHADARAAGVRIETDRAAIELTEADGRVTGVLTAEAELITADVTVVATGSWATVVVPELKNALRATGHPILLLRVPDPERWRPPKFGPWAADIATTGWYGFPARADGTIKIARHAAGVPVPTGAPRRVRADQIDAARAFLAETLPELADAPLVSTRLCAYADAFDGHFWIDRHPEKPGLVVAGGGSGHAFKFAPVLGARIAAAVEDRRADIEPRFRWRTVGDPGKEGARAR